MPGAVCVEDDAGLWNGPEPLDPCAPPAVPGVSSKLRGNGTTGGSGGTNCLRSIGLPHLSSCAAAPPGAHSGTTQSASNAQLGRFMGFAPSGEGSDRSFGTIADSN